MTDTSATMEVKTETDEIDNTDIQTSATDKAPNEGKEMKLSSDNDNINIATQENKTIITENINVTVEIVKEEMETTQTDTETKVDSELPEIGNDKETLEEGDPNVQIKIQNTPETETAVENTVKQTEVPKATERTDDESESSSKLVNPLKRKRCRPPKRRRKPKMHRVTTDNASELVPESESVDTSTEVCKEEVEYCLTVSNLPNSWSFMDIKNYVDTECGPVDEIEMIKDEKTNNGAIRLSYQTEEECKSAKEKLKDKEIAGNKLVLEITAVTLESDPDQSETAETGIKPWKPDLDSWEVDIHGMYGLKLQYLRSLGITPPLDKWVHVSNFRCDKSELRDVMEMAGNVLMCSAFTVNHRYANVMYSHPLEAVQAVAMLNNQKFYGQPLKVAMDRSPSNTVLLPKGLGNIGSGLGLNGKPLRNIVKHYERFVENKECLINPVVFDIPANHSLKLSSGSDVVKFEVKSVEDFNYPELPKVAVTKATTATAVTPVKSVMVPQPVPKPLKPAPVQSPAYTLPQPKPVSAPTNANFTPSFPHGPFQPNFRPAPFVGPVMNGQGMPSAQGPPVQVGPQMMPTGPRPPHPGFVGPARPQPPGFAGPPRPQFARPFPGPGPAWGRGAGPMMPGPRPGPTGPMFPNEPVKLILSNLPPSTTFALLCEKMSEWGHVVCIQLTTPGSAVVTFANRMQADACLQHFNGRNIENYFLQVKYAI